MPKSNNPGGNANRAVTVSDLNVLVSKIANTTPKRARKRNGGGSGGAIAAARASASAAQGPTIGKTTGAIKVANQEFVTDLVTVTTSATFQTEINPSVHSFRWLSRVASGYEMFRFTRCVVHYTPMCSTQVPGMVVMAYDYDASDLPPVGKHVLAGYQGAVRGNVWNKLSAPMRPPPGWFYCGSPGGIINPPGTDIKLYVPAKFYLGVYGSTPSTTVGEISIEYQVEFMKPDLTVAPSPSGYYLFPGSNLPGLVGGPQYAGNVGVIFRSVSSGVFEMLFSTVGQFLFIVIAQFRSSTGPVNASPFSEVTITSPDAGSVNARVVETSIGGWVNSTTNWFADVHILIPAVAGTVVRFTTDPVINFGFLERARLSSYDLTLPS